MSTWFAYLWTRCRHVEPTRRQPTTNFRCSASQYSEGVNCFSEEAWNLSLVKSCVNADFICQWKIYWRGVLEFSMGVVIREMHLSDEANCMECGFYSVVCSLCTFGGRWLFWTDCISSNWILTSYNIWVHYGISNNGKHKDRFNCWDLWSSVFTTVTCAVSDKTQLHKNTNSMEFQRIRLRTEYLQEFYKCFTKYENLFSRIGKAYKQRIWKCGPPDPGVRMAL